MPEKPADDEEREQRLRSYSRKDYTEEIDFPVELVDRDGVIRRYTYEESLAVYHRRIQSAPWRHIDESLVQAEVDHCTRRIAQIKQSYHVLQEDGRVAPSSNPRATLGPGYSVLMGYYEKVLERRDLTVTDHFLPQVQLLQDSSSCRIYHVGFGRSGGGHLFTVYPFGQGHSAHGRSRFVEAKTSLRSVPQGQDVERLLLAEESERAGYILTGTTELPPGLRDFCAVIQRSGTLGELPTLSDEGVPQRPGSGPIAPGQAAYEAGLVAVQEDRIDEAIVHFTASVEANPYHRESYLLLLALLDGAGRYAEGKLYGDLAERNLPDDGLVAYRQGIAAVRQADLKAALVYFDRAGDVAGTLYQPHFFGAHVRLVQGGDLGDVAQRLRTAVDLAEGRPQVEDSLRAVERCIVVRKVLRISAASGAIVSLAALQALSPLAAVPLVFFVGVGAAARPFSEALARLLARRCFEEPG
jgi:tetratricopeptide (TPR) repeat protein